MIIRSRDRRRPANGGDGGVGIAVAQVHHELGQPATDEVERRRHRIVGLLRPCSPDFHVGRPSRSAARCDRDHSRWRICHGPYRRAELGPVGRSTYFSARRFWGHGADLRPRRLRPRRARGSEGGDRDHDVARTARSQRGEDHRLGDRRVRAAAREPRRRARRGRLAVDRRTAAVAADAGATVVALDAVAPGRARRSGARGRRCGAALLATVR